MKSPGECIMVCENFTDEVISAVSLEGLKDVSVVSFPSRCGQPPLHWDEISERASAAAKSFQHVLVFGGCCLASLTTQPQCLENCRLVRREPCYSLAAPRELIDSCAATGTYLVTQGWLSHWRERVRRWGPDRASIRALLGDAVQRIAFLATGCRIDRVDDLEEVSAFLELPWEVIPVGSDRIRACLREALGETTETDESRERE